MTPRLSVSLAFACLLAVSALAALPPLPPPQGVAAPGPRTGAPYQPLPLLSGGVVVPLYPPDSPLLRREQLSEPEQYHWYGEGRAGVDYIIGIHNPSIEFHRAHAPLNNGTTIILCAGGGHNVLSVGGESMAEVEYFRLHGINTVILRYRLRRDGYDPKVDAVNDTLQAIKLVRAYAAELKIDPRRIGVMGFSAGAEPATAASLFWADFDRQQDVAGNPLAKVSSRPDFTALIYPGPSPFARGATPAIPRDCPPSFLASPGWGDRQHAIWATEYFDALLRDGVPNVEIHLYARGHHPGDKVAPGEPPATGGVTSMGGIAFGTWPLRFLDWLRDLGFMQPAGTETQAARDVAARLAKSP